MKRLSEDLDSALSEGRPASPDQVDAMLADPSHATRSFGVEFESRGSVNDRAEEIAYALGYQEGHTGKPMAMTASLLSWGKARKVPSVKTSYEEGKTDGKAAAT